MKYSLAVLNTKMCSQGSPEQQRFSAEHVTVASVLWFATGGGPGLSPLCLNMLCYGKISKLARTGCRAWTPHRTLSGMALRIISYTKTGDLLC